MRIEQSISLAMALAGLFIELRVPGWGVLMVLVGIAGLLIWSEP